MKIGSGPLSTRTYASMLESDGAERKITQQTKAFAGTIREAYEMCPQYNAKGMMDEKIEVRKLSITEAQLQEMLQNDALQLETDGKIYWMIVEGIRYEFSICSKEDEKRVSNTEILLDTVQDCIDRAQERLDKKFYDWTMKKDIRHPHVGKNAMITLEDVIEKKMERKKEEKLSDKNE